MKKQLCKQISANKIQKVRQRRGEGGGMKGEREGRREIWEERGRERLGY